MFTGIVQAVGRIVRLDPLEIDAAGLDLADVAVGDSIAVQGVCLTVTARTAKGFTADVSAETRRVTTGLDRAGAAVNLEKSVALGERLGGHLVAGHVDGVGEVLAFKDGVLRVRAPRELSRYIARKGSITLDGVSLTVNRVDGDAFEVQLIPHTLEVTTLGALEAGGRVNLEVDLMARYADRRSFLRRGISGTFLLGAAGGAAAGAAGTVALAPKLLRPPPLPGKLSYAEAGEDIVLWQIAAGVLGIEHPTYLDVGAHHPVVNNNTFYFYERGARGVLVEPNPALHDLLTAVRPNDTLLRAGIGPAAQSEADFYIIGGSEDGQLNTFSRDQAMQLVTRSRGHYRIDRVIKLPLLDINDVMRKHWNRAPNVLSVDTEGYDLPILRSIDFKRFRPDVIVAETSELGGRRFEIEIPELLAQHGYEVRGGSFVNTIFVDRRHTA